MDILLLELEYKKRINLFKLLEEEVIFIIDNKLSETNIKISNIEHRIKSKDSFINKAIIYDYNEPFSYIRDILGVRIITLFLSDITKVISIVEKSFDVIEKDDKINSSHSNFGYLSVHLIAKLKNEFIGPRYDNIKDLLFEIQIRTITMHSWANISHYLDYKGDFDIPTELKKDFFALSGLFYIADQHFELFFNQSKKNRKLIEKKFEQGVNITNQEINLDSLRSYLKTKLPDRVHVQKKDISELVEELKALGYISFQQIEDAFTRGWSTFLKYEKDFFPKANNKYKKFADIGVIRTLLDILDEKFRLYRTKNSDYTKYIKYRNMLKK
jgi:putative GTP pyrophosphokinase